MNQAKYISFTLLAYFMIICTTNAQDTTVTITKYYDYGKLDSYNKTWQINDRTIKSVTLSNRRLRINTSTWIDTFCYSNWVILEPKLPKDVDPFSIFTTSYKEDSAVKTKTYLQTFDGDFFEYPCDCFEDVLHTEILDLECILACELDTIDQSTNINHYRRDGKLHYCLEQKGDEWIFTDRRTYDSKGNWLTEWNRCDTFSYKYDSLNRRTYQYFNYRCDTFKYFLETIYTSDSAITTGTKDNITRLSSIKIPISDSTYLHESFYKNGDVHKTIYQGQNEEHPISKVTYKRSGEIEKTEFQYINRDDYFEKVTIRNGHEIRKKTVQTFQL